MLASCTEEAVGVLAGVVVDAQRPPLARAGARRLRGQAIRACARWVAEAGKFCIQKITAGTKSDLVY